MARPMIAVDARYSLRPLRRGIGEMVYRVCRELADMPRSYDLILYGDGSADPEVVREFSTAFRVEILSARPFAVWEQWAWPQRAAGDGATLLHGTANIAPLSWRGPLILTVLDVIEWHRGRDFASSIPLRHHISRLYRMNTLKRVVQRADAVLTISAHARDDMVRTLHVASDRIVITPLATKLSIQAPVLTKRPYFLALGAMDPRKNLIGVLHALKAANQKKFRLKIVGVEPQFLSKSRELLNSLGIQDQVDLSPMVSDEELTELYQNAAGFLYLSLYEGFGLPLLEAMALGCPVISSNRAALPEVGGDGVILVDPFDASATADAMQKLIADVAFRNDLIRRGQSRVASFGWKQTAELTHDCYLRVIRHRGLGGEVQ